MKQVTSFIPSSFRMIRDLEKRLVSIPIHVLRNIPERIAVAGGESKAQAVQGLLRSGLITVLVTDEVAAKKLL